ncbi:MAG: hypothetical protein ACYSUD_17395 [Planctomycetota bacterium]
MIPTLPNAMCRTAWIPAAVLEKATPRTSPTPDVSSAMTLHNPTYNR